MIRIYCSKRKETENRSKDLSDIGQLRWDLYSKENIDGDWLPPTPDALKFKLMRSNFIALVWKRKIVSFSPDIPTIGENYGWKIVEERLVALMTDHLPAPESP